MRERIYRLLLWFFPDEFRTRFGPEMIATARALDRRHKSGFASLGRAFFDAVMTLYRVRQDIGTESQKAESPGWRTSMNGIVQDIWFAMRSLRRDSLFTVFVVATLTLGIGVNAVMFGIVDRLLLRGPDHVKDADRVVRFYLSTMPPGMRAFTTSGFGNVSFDVLRRDNRHFEDIAAYTVNDAVMGKGNDAREVRAGYASANLFPLLGAAASIGRFFNESENLPATVTNVTVLGYHAWRTWYGGRPDVLGTTVTLGDQPFSIIGVAPRGFTGPQLGRVDFWVPINVIGQRMGPDWQTTWNSQWHRIIGRLKPDATIEAASGEATEAHRRAYTGDEKYVATGRMFVARLSANDAGVEAPDVTVVRWLTGVAIVVLLIACANVTNLLLARGLKRSREIAVRAALGAHRSRLVRLLLAESVILALAAATFGSVVAYGLGGVARQFLFSAVEWDAVPVDTRMLAASGAIALVTGLFVGLLPAWRASRTNLTDALKRGQREGGGQRSRVRTALTIAQAALSVILLVGAGLFVRSLWNVQSLHLGIEPDRVLVAHVHRPRLNRNPNAGSFEALAVERLKQVPGAEQVSVAVGLPFGNRFTVQLRVPGMETLPRLKSGGPGVSAIGEGYFATVGTRILRGRAFDSGDRAGSEPVAIVSDLMAKTFWPGDDPIGKCIISGVDPAPCARIVGIAENTHRSRLREDPAMHYYVPFGQQVGFGGTEILVRRSENPLMLGPSVRDALLEVDPGITYVDLETIQERIDPQTKPWRLGAVAFSASGVLALLVAAVGIYSVMSYLVADRTHEIGVRVALGATGRDIVRLVFRGTIGMASVGILAGTVGAVAAGPFVEPLLFNVSGRDPWVYGIVAAVLLVVAFIAGLVPSIRANRINTLEALRSE